MAFLNNKTIIFVQIIIFHLKMPKIIGVGNSMFSLGTFDKHHKWFFKIHQNIWGVTKYHMQTSIYPKYPREIMLFFFVWYYYWEHTSMKTVIFTCKTISTLAEILLVLASHISEISQSDKYNNNHYWQGYATMFDTKFEL